MLRWLAQMPPREALEDVRETGFTSLIPVFIETPICRELQFAPVAIFHR
jgi:hypothetical protein